MRRREDVEKPQHPVEKLDQRVEDRVRADRMKRVYILAGPDYLRGKTGYVQNNTSLVLAVPRNFGPSNMPETTAGVVALFEYAVPASSLAYEEVPW